MTTAGDSDQERWIRGRGPCLCWWTGGGLHGGHCCFLGPMADAAFAGEAAHCHDVCAADNCRLPAAHDCDHIPVVA